MTDYELYGPWTGNAVHIPKPIKRSWRPHIAFFLCAMAIVTGMLIAISQIGV